jgi:hypothetical protein
MLKSTLLAMLAMLSGCGLPLGGASSKTSGSGQSQSQKLSDDERLGSFTLLMMDIVKADLSSLRRQILARTLVRVTGEIFTDYRHREAFVGIVAQESRFSASAKSSAGATGIAQLMPQYASDFARLCGLSDFKQADLLDVELNLYLGACYYRDLLEKLGGNTTSAQVAYNGGLYGAGLKSLLAQQNISNTENSNYPTQISYKKEEARLAQEKVESVSIASIDVDSSKPVSVAIEDASAEASQTSILRVKYRIKNIDTNTTATGTTVLVGIFVAKDGSRIYVTNPPVVEGSNPGVIDLANLNRQARPFSFKGSKQMELVLNSPKNLEGSFEVVRILTTDSRTGGQIAVDVKI